MPGYKYKGDRPESSPEQAPTPEAEPRPLDVWIPRAEAEDRIKAAETVAHRAAAALERERAERAGERVAVRERARATERLRAAERDKFRAVVEQLRTRLRAVHRERAAAEVRVKALEGALADSCKIVEDLTAQRDHATARAITYQARLDMIHAQSRSIPEKREQTP